MEEAKLTKSCMAHVLSKERDRGRRKPLPFSMRFKHGGSCYVPPKVLSLACLPCRGFRDTVGSCLVHHVAHVGLCLSPTPEVGILWIALLSRAQARAGDICHFGRWAIGFGHAVVVAVVRWNGVSGPG